MSAVKGRLGERAVAARLRDEGWTVWNLSPTESFDLLSMRRRGGRLYEVEYHEVKCGPYARLTPAEKAFASTVNVTWNLWRVSSSGKEVTLELRQSP